VKPATLGVDLVAARARANDSPVIANVLKALRTVASR
jgi:hypothetical protein